jgi:hypothetical protein
MKIEESLGFKLAKASQRMFELLQLALIKLVLHQSKMEQC